VERIKERFATAFGESNDNTAAWNNIFYCEQKGVFGRNDGVPLPDAGSNGDVEGGASPSSEDDGSGGAVLDQESADVNQAVDDLQGRMNEVQTHQGQRG
jgi:hypothetical protein